MHECRVCGETTEWIPDGIPDDDWQLAVRLREAQTPSHTETEMRRWRKMRLASLGFAGALLDLLVESPVDVHEAERLVKGGCPFETAAHILL